MNASITAEMERSPLLDLPPELRNTVWRFALVRKTKIDMSKESTTAEPALLVACKQIREEGLGIYYGENMFSLGAELVDWDWSTTLSDWLSAIGHERAGRIARLCITAVGLPSDDLSPYRYDTVSYLYRQLCGAPIKQMLDELKSRGISVSAIYAEQPASKRSKRDAYEMTLYHELGKYKAEANADVAQR